MNLKKWLFGHSLVWIGLLYSSSECVNAETLLPSEPDTVDRESYIEGTRSSNTPAAPVAAIADVAHPEFLPLPLERYKAQNPNSKPGVAVPTPFAPTHVPVPEHSLEPQQAEEVAQAEETEQQEEPSIPATPYPDVPTPTDPDFELDQPVDENGGEVPEPVPESAEAADPELGRLRLRERELAIEQEDVDIVFLRARVDYFRSDNILLDDFDAIDDQIIRAGVSLLAFPSLGPQTQLIASVGGNLSRYGELSELDYNDLEFRVAIRQDLFPRTYGEISWRNQQFFSADDGDRFLSDHSFRLSLARRDQLAPQLTLDSFYQLRLSFTDPSDRARLSNTLGTSLSYSLQPDLEVGLDYQLVLTDFTQREREDTYHQVTAQLSYDLSRSSRVSLFAGLSFGRSSEADVDFDSSIVGVVFDTTLSLF